MAEPVDTASKPFAALRSEVDLMPPASRAAISAAYRLPESQAVQALLSRTYSSPAEIRSLASALVRAVRAKRTHAGGMDALMQEFSLSSEEGIALMCVAEALLRIPDSASADRLIADKLRKADWRRHLGTSPSLFVNAAAWGLLISGKLVSTDSEQRLSAAFTRLLSRSGEALIRKAMTVAMRMLGSQFVMGQTIEAALERSQEQLARGYRYSYDMLGEAALTADDALRYYTAYENAIQAIGRSATGNCITDRPGISVKLSALHPRYARSQRTRVMAELLPRLKALTLLCKHFRLGLNIDAEEADRLELSLDLVEALCRDEDIAGFDGLGIVVQAYQKRCPFVIDHLVGLAQTYHQRLMVRLVKGAYWDSEIKRAQIDGMPEYAVYTRKAHTDLAYLACARQLLAAANHVYPQFATHNAHTLSAIHVWALEAGVSKYEFQCLHGMGESLYDEVVGATGWKHSCRIYAPVGSHDTLLAYLVRRLLENGANSSFVHRLVDDSVSIDELVADPIEIVRRTSGSSHPFIPLPLDLFHPERRNSTGLDLSDEQVLRSLANYLSNDSPLQWTAAGLIAGMNSVGSPVPIRNPADHNDIVGFITNSSLEEIGIALEAALHSSWAQTSANRRSTILMRAADLFEANRIELISLLVREAGKSLGSAIGEIREAADFLRYYACGIDILRGEPLGPVACISPWNFPLSIFVGQIAGALAAGNSVLAKPAEQTPLIAWRAVQLLHEAGVFHDALQYIPGSGETVGAALVNDDRIRGVVFTGSTEVARLIYRALAVRTSLEEIPLIAETGGLNAMIVDSSALPEQVVQDVLSSAFDSAGQRCSALRILCVQEDIADAVRAMLLSAMRELTVGRPDRLSNDIGPVIDAAALKNIVAHIDVCCRAGMPVHQGRLDADTARGNFVAPTVIEIPDLSCIKREVFGPVLHLLRYRRENLDELLDGINCLGYGLTMGVHSRIDETIEVVKRRACVGNLYVNRNMIGAVVGVQPFGGERLSGTGPKAGGPFYLGRLQKSQPPDPVKATAEDDQPSFHKEEPEESPRWKDFMAAAGPDGAKLSLALRHALQGFKTHFVLPGPTGETNELVLVPRAKVLCAGLSSAALVWQIALCCRIGNGICVPSARRESLPLPMRLFMDRHGEWINDIGSASVDLVLTDSEELRRLSILFSGREGPLVQVAICTPDSGFDAVRLMLERTRTVNTTASGGNASLMTLCEG